MYHCIFVTHVKEVEWEPCCVVNFDASIDIYANADVMCEQRSDHTYCQHQRLRQIVSVASVIAELSQH